MRAIEEIIRENFVNPLAYPDKYPPYNPVNTIVFAAIALAAAYLIFKGIKRLGLAVDERFAKAVVPFALFGATVRVLVDAQALPRAVEIAGQTIYPFVTPLVYVNAFLAFVLAFVATKAAAGGDGGKTLSALEKIGWLLFAVALLPLAPLFKNFVFGAEIAFLAALGVAAYVLLARRGLVDRSSFASLAVAGQCLDGAATFVGVSFAGYFEQHVLSPMRFSPSARHSSFTW